MATDYTDMLLAENLTYRIRNALIEVSSRYGAGHKERVYQQACAEVFQRGAIPYISQPQIDIHSLDTGRKIAVHIPDFVIADCVVVELKAVPQLAFAAVVQLDTYLRATTFEIGILVNFGTPRAEIIRRIYTNDRKPLAAARHTASV